MALKKAGSRSITVDGATYRWAFADNGDVWNVSIQSATGSGQKLVLSWPTYPRPTQSITPSLVARAIHQGLAADWAPSIDGPPLHAGFKDNVLTIHRIVIPDVAEI